MTLSQSIIMSFFEIMYYLLISKKLLSETIKIKHYLTAVLLGGFFVGLTSEIIIEPFGTLLSGVIFFSIVLIIYNIKILDALKVYLLSTIIVTAIQFLSLVPLQVIRGSIEYNFINGLISQGVTLFIVYITYKFIPIDNIMYFINKKDKLFSYITANAFVIVTLLIVYWKINMQGIVENLIGVSVLSFILVTVNLVIIRKGFENKKTEELLKIQRKYMPVYEQLVDTIRKKQHDFNNHINAINMIVETNDSPDDIKNKLRKYTGEITSAMPDELLKLENTVVAGFIYSKIIEAESKNISIKTDISLNSLSKILTDSQWVEVLGILLDNAIEASDKGDTIYLSIKKDLKYTITVKNRYKYMKMDTINKYFEKGFSTKSKSRGIGLYNLKNIIKKSNGNIEFSNETIDSKNYIVFRLIVPQ